MGNDPGRISLVAFDFDGVFTDNRVYVDQDGRESVCCSRSDGIGIRKLDRAGIKSIVISAETNPVVEKRCAKLGIRCVAGCKDKLSVLKAAMAESGVGRESVCFVGNDLPDIECLRYAGLPVAVRDSCPEVLDAAKYVTSAPGGRGAVREVCDMIVNEGRK